MERDWIAQERPLRVIQTNLQVNDTPGMDPERLAEQIVALGGNALVMNVGGIYAWYPTKVPFHTVNPHLPTETDLLSDIIDACHRRDLLLFARFDFSKADDQVFLQNPDWFVRDEENRQRLIGATRPGPWPLLALTCLNAPYRNEAVAIPVLKEVMAQYPIDAIFLNAPHYERCHCVRCQNLYAEEFKETLPERDADIPQAWVDRSFQRNVRNLHNAIKEQDATLPLILYYGNQPAFSAEVAEMLCTESQNVLSRGLRHIPRIHEPAVNTKLGCSVEHLPPPFGIIHSSPGMEWRHTGLPAAEYRFWMSQIPANGGWLWHSLTGYPDTILDKRVLETVEAVNRDAEKVEKLMKHLKPASDVLLLWDGSAAADGWAGLLTRNRVQYDVLPVDQASEARLRRYRIVVAPDGIGSSFSVSFISDSNTATESSIGSLLEAYVRSGGNLLLESTHAFPDEPLRNLAGIAPDAQPSEPLRAAYLRIETGGGIPGMDPGENCLLPLAGTVLHTRLAPEQTQNQENAQTHTQMHTQTQPQTQTQNQPTILATLVPPFSPVESVGAPPERASLPVPQTQIPLITLRPHEEGQVLFLSFGLGEMARTYGLADHEQLSDGLIQLLRGECAEVALTQDIPGVLLNVWTNKQTNRQSNRHMGINFDTDMQSPDSNEQHIRLIHLVNGVGERPLRRCVQVRDVALSVRLLSGESVEDVRTLMDAGNFEWQKVEDNLFITVPRLNVWEAVCVTTRMNEGITLL